MATFAEAYGQRLKYNFVSSFKLMFWPFTSDHNTVGMKVAFSPLFPLMFVFGLVSLAYNATIGLVTTAIKLFIDTELKLDNAFLVTKEQNPYLGSVETFAKGQDQLYSTLLAVDKLANAATVSDCKEATQTAVFAAGMRSF